MKKNLLFIIHAADVVDAYGIAILGAVARQAGWNVELAEYDAGTIDRVFAAFPPDIVAYSVMSCDASQYLRINAALKQRYAFVSIMGGDHPTDFPEVVDMEGIDYICRGEGELALADFLTRFAAGADLDHIANFSSKRVRNPMRPLIQDLDALPLPDRSLVFDRIPRIGRSPYKTFIPSRGCPYACAYCHNGARIRELRSKGPLVRSMSVTRLIAEIQAVRSRYPLAFIKFMDDIFAPKADWLQAFAETYRREVGIPFTCMQRLEYIQPERLKLLKEAGCVSLSISLDSVDPRIRNDILGRRMSLSNDEIRRRFRMVKEAGLHLMSNVIIGVPTGTAQDAIDAVRFCREAKVDFAHATMLVPHPRTPVWDYCRQHGFLAEQAEPVYSGLMQARSELTCFTDKEKDYLWNLMVLFPALGRWPRLEPALLWLAAHVRPNAAFSIFFMIMKGYLYRRYIFPAPGATAGSIPIFWMTLKLEVRRMMGRHPNPVSV